VRQREAWKAGTGRRHVRILGQRVASEQREGDATGLEERHFRLAAGGFAPAQRAVEGTAPGEVADAQGDEADRLFHAKLSRNANTRTGALHQQQPTASTSDTPAPSDVAAQQKNSRFLTTESRLAR
jgi:hypothetical protein